jgi:hypothetical protein
VSGMFTKERWNAMSVVVFGWNAHMDYFVGGMLARDRWNASSIVDSAVI